MTDEQALLRNILATPADDLPRLVYADWLEEHPTDSVQCPTCHGTRKVGYMSGMPYTCDKCNGAGSVTAPNGNAERAEFIRVQVELAGLPDCLTPSVGARESGSGKPLACWQCRPRNKRGCLPWCKACERRDDLRRRVDELWNPLFPVLLAELPDRSWTLRPDAPHPSVHDPHAVFRRGFVEEVRAPLAVLFGGPCENCGGFGEFHRRHDNGDGPEGPCPECGGKWNSGPHSDADSYWDRGTGTTPGVAAALWRSQPVTRVVPVGAEPSEWSREDGGTNYVWTVRTENQIDIPGDIPRELFRLLKGGRVNQDNWTCRYPTRAAAIDALSAACVAHGRALAGLDRPPQ